MAAPWALSPVFNPALMTHVTHVTHVTRGLNETAEAHLDCRNETLPVSRGFMQLFRPM